MNNLRRAVFDSPEQAITVMYGMLARLSALVMWLLFASAHLMVAVLAIAACWALGITAADMQTLYLKAMQSTPAGVLAFFGASAGTLVAGWVWFLRKMHQAAAGAWLVDYLLAGQ